MSTMPATPTMFYDSYDISAHGRNPGNVNLLTYTPEYFAGADVSIYLGDQFLDEVVSLSFTMQQATQPIFSYASYTYDMLAVGARQIQGSFAINFRDPFYLENKAAFSTGQATTSDSVMTPNSTLLATMQANQTILAKYPDLAGATTFPPDVMLAIVTESDSDITALINWVQSYNWGDVTTTLQTQQTQPFFGQTFDIVIVYGEIPHVDDYTTSGGVSYNSSMDTLTTAFNLLQSLGPAIMLAQVQITGVAQAPSIEDDGATLLEHYSFIAKDLIRQPTVGTSSGTS
jgi:hypothetical protein